MKSQINKNVDFKSTSTFDIKMAHGFGLWVIQTGGLWQ